MGAHPERENGVQNNMAHEAIVVRGLRGKTPRNFLVLMILGTGPGSEVIEQSLMISHYSPLFLDWVPLMVHTKCAAIDQNTGHIKRCKKIKDWLLGPS